MDHPIVHLPCNFSNPFRRNRRNRDDRSRRTLLISNRPPPRLGRIRRRLIIRWSMSLTKCRLLDQHRFSTGRLHSSHPHAKSRLLSTSHVKSGIAIALVTLNACPNSSSLANIAGQSPPGRRNALDTVDRLQEHCVCEPNLRDPESTDNVSPGSWSVSLFESSTSVWTKDTVDCPGWTLKASSAEPLAFWNVGDAVTVLMNGEIAHVAEQNCVAVLAFAVHADAADSIFVGGDSSSSVGLLLEVRLLLETIHQQLESVGFHWRC